MQTKVVHLPDLPDRSVRYFESGGGKSAMVLLHAFPLSAEQWMPQLARVPSGARVIAPDLRGFHGTGAGFTHAGLDGVTMDTYAADVFALMTHLEIERAVIGGVSMGGYLTFALFRKAPQRFQAMILSDTQSAGDTPEIKEGRVKMQALVREQGSAAIADAMTPKLLGPTALAGQRVPDRVRRLIAAASADGIHAALEALKTRPDSTDLLEDITCPTLIVVGADDELTPPDKAEAMQQRIDNAALTVIPAAGHLPGLEQPLAFNAVLWEFLRTL